MAKMNKLEDKMIYAYDKVKGFEAYDPFTMFEYNGYTFDKLFQSFVKIKSEYKELFNKYHALLEQLDTKGVKLEGDTLYLKQTKDKQWVRVNIDDGFVSNVSIIASDDVFLLSNGLIPNDVESGVYELKNGGIIKNNKKELEKWFMQF